jgi:hypothetical protein
MMMTRTMCDHGRRTKKMMKTREIKIILFVSGKVEAG